MPPLPAPPPLAAPDPLSPFSLLALMCCPPLPAPPALWSIDDGYCCCWWWWWWCVRSISISSLTSNCDVMRKYNNNQCACNRYLFPTIRRFSQASSLQINLLTRNKQTKKTKKNHWVHKHKIVYCSFYKVVDDIARMMRTQGEYYIVRTTAIIVIVFVCVCACNSLLVCIVNCGVYSCKRSLSLFLFAFALALSPLSLSRRHLLAIVATFRR